MATATKTKDAPEAQELPEFFKKMNVRTGDVAEAPKIKRGRKPKGPTPEVLFCRAGLEDSLATGRIKTFEGIANKKDREVFAKFIRDAAKIEPQIVARTRYDEQAQVLYWGPESVVEKLVQASE